jgi:hypothetical protein
MEMSQGMSREYKDIFEDGRLVTMGRPFCIIVHSGGIFEQPSRGRR